MPKNHKIVLASGSPRRRELMDMIGAHYIVIPSQKDEDMSCSDPATLVERLAKMKAEDVAQIINDRIKSGELGNEYTDCVVIGCDTVVANNGQILGKPYNDENATKMIQAIEGHSHEVYTGVCILKMSGGEAEACENYSVCSRVHVAHMTDQEISDYVSTGESLDKAGAYAVQGRFCPFIEGIEGDYYNIVGYPVHSIYKTLNELGISL